MTIPVYKGDQVKKVHPIDLPAWLEEGWTLEKSESPPAKPPTKTTTFKTVAKEKEGET